MGIYDWKDTDKQGGGSCPVMSIWYAAVLGNQLLQRIKQGNDKVDLLPKNQVSLLTIHSLLQQDQIESNVYNLVYKVAKAEGAVAKLTEQLALSEAWVAKLEGLVEEQRKTSEDFKDQMSILVSKLLERDSNVEQSFETVEKQLNHHRFALNKAEDQVHLQVLQQRAMSSERLCHCGDIPKGLVSETFRQQSPP